MTKWVVGNWKMYGGPLKTARSLAESIAAHAPPPQVKVIICPPAPYLSAVAGFSIAVGGQDCHNKTEGAFTGDTSASMLKDCGCAYVIVGHSERRQYHHENSELVRQKAEAALAAGLIPIICIGETLADRQAGKAEAVVGEQVRGSLPKSVQSGNFLLAYEPVWAIGSGQTPTTADIRQMHAYIKQAAPGANVLYGGSVKAANAAEIMATDGVDGVLVGGASLKADEFIKIIDAAR